MIDDPYLTLVRRDISGGINDRQHGSEIKENQVTVLNNVELTIAGKSAKRSGSNLIEDLGDTVGIGAIGFEPLDGSDELIVTHGQKIEGNTDPTGAFSEHKNDVTTNGAQTNILQVFKSGGDGSVLWINNGTDDIIEMEQDHTCTDLTDDGDDAPPKGSRAMTFFRGRPWILKDNYAYYGDAYSTDYTAAFNQATEVFHIPVGATDNMHGAIIPIRDQGLVFLGTESIYALNPSMTPAATDKPAKLLDIGCVAEKSAIQVGDDILFLAKDGIRGLFRTIQDKVQLGQSFPLSFPLTIPKL